MPHVIVKLWPGKTADQKQRLTDAIVDSVTSLLDYDDDAVSVALEEVTPNDWTREVVEPDVLGKWELLSKRPGYVSP